MYISKLHLHPNSTKDAYTAHQRIWKAFGNPRDKGSDRPFLFYQADDRTVVVISAEMPRDEAVVYMRKLENEFCAGKKYHFRACVNPAKRDGATGKIKALGTEEEMTEWLRRKMAPAGRVLNSFILKRTMKVGRKKQISFSAVEIEGILECTDPEELWKIYTGGIGREKSFGCGTVLLKTAG